MSVSRGLLSNRSTHGVPPGPAAAQVGGLRQEAGWMGVRSTPWLVWSLPCPPWEETQCLRPGRVGHGHSPRPGLHPRDPDLEGGPACGGAQLSLKHPWSCAFWIKSPPQPLPSGQPCPAAPGLAKPSARAFEEGALPVGAGAVGPSPPGTAWCQLSGMSPVGQSRLSSWLVLERRLSGDPTLCPAHPPPQLQVCGPFRGS